MLVSRFSSA
jgi:hypothetical protein